MNEERNKRQEWTFASAKGRRVRMNGKKLARSAGLLACIIAGILLAVNFSDKPAPVSAAASAPETVPAAAAETNYLEGKRIVLDAGHGGFDIGATGVSGAQEAELNLAVANLLKTEFENRGASVVMTREDEGAIADSKDADMQKRREIIQSSSSDIVVSVHMNTAEAPEVSGPVVLFMPGSVQGELLAGAIQASLIENLDPVSQNSARSEEMYILESGAQPCVIVECGFISNAADEALLVSEAYQKKAAAAIADGCADYFGQTEERQ